MKVTRVIDIELPPDKVFDLIARVEDFSKYSSFIKEVKEIGPRMHRWKAEIRGMEFEWDSILTEFEKPRHLGWESTRGIRNSGSYTLKGIDGSTRVYFTMECHLPLDILDALVEPLLKDLIKSISDDILANMKKQLEGDGKKAKKECPKEKIDPLLIIFDLDGTLVDSSEDIAYALNKTLKALNMNELPLKEIVSYIGWGVGMLLEQALPFDKHHLLEDAKRFFLNFYADNLLVKTRLYPGVLKTLINLKHKDKIMAIVTNKPFNLSKEVITGLKIDGFFATLIGGDSISNKKPNPEGVNKVMKALSVPPQKTVLVGDSKVDIMAGKAAGIDTIGAAYGFRGFEELKEAGADLIINSPQELLDIMV